MKKLIILNKQGKNVGVVFVDDADFPKIKGIQWHKTSKGYAAYSMYLGGGRTRAKYKTVLMHRMLLGLPAKLPWVDHINRNKMDNRRANLRHADGTLNNINKPMQKNNKSGHRGVFQRRRKIGGYWYSYWFAQITIRRKVIHIGQSKDLMTAVKMRREAEKRYGFA